VWYWVHCLGARLARPRAVLGLVAQGFELLELVPVLVVLKPGNWVVGHLAAVPVDAVGLGW
jgi:hypothetical protein